MFNRHLTQMALILDTLNRKPDLAACICLLLGRTLAWFIVQNSARSGRSGFWGRASRLAGFGMHFAETDIAGSESWSYFPAGAPARASDGALRYHKASMKCHGRSTFVTAQNVEREGETEQLILHRKTGVDLDQCWIANFGEDHRLVLQKKADLEVLIALDLLKPVRRAASASRGKIVTQLGNRQYFIKSQR